MVGSNLDRQPLDQELDELPPGFADIRGENGMRFVSQCRGQAVPRCNERCGKRLHPFRQCEFFGELCEFSAEHNEGVGAEPLERFRGDFGSDPGMPVAIPAHPGAEADLRKLVLAFQKCLVKSRVNPGVPEPLVKFRKHGWKNIAQVVEHVAAFVGEFRLFEQNFPGPPKPFERSFRLLAHGSLLGRGNSSLIARGKQCVNRPVLVQHGQPLRLRRVGG